MFKFIYLTYSTNLHLLSVCSLAIFSGLRRAELAALTTDDVTKHHDSTISVFVRNGKGSKQRSVTLPGAFGRELYAFALAKGPQTSLFEATAQTIANRWKAVCNKSGLPACSTHWSRHAYTTLSLSGDKDGSRPSLIAVSRSLGHSSCSQTSTYMHSLDRKAPSAFINLDSDDEGPSATVKTVQKKKKLSREERAARALARLA